ncbi:fibronectin type III domain-containing protein [Phytohabitans rumicis]|uniref:fibronectin type III domain-containing protein n=1 Tax=Phytohabitans rumicis TaxID=1076125 RepID=UPI002483A8C3|nr:tetratricopeptide repeat protein [Phytohabitans rumicis]
MSQPSHLALAQQNARAMRDAGDLSNARVMLDQTLEGARAALGEDSPEVLATAHVLAGLHREAGDPAAARRVLEEAYGAGQLRLGDAHPLMLAISFDLGGVAEELGNRHEARRAFGRVAAHGPAVLGDEHWTVRAAREYLGDAQPSVELTIPPELPPPPPPMQFPSSAAFSIPSAPQPSAPPAPIHPAPVHTPNYSQEPTYQVRPPRRVRGATVAAMIAAAAAVVAAGFVGIQVFMNSGGDDPGTRQTQGPRLAGDPPTELSLRVDGTAITVTWKDPSDGTVPFIVSGAQTGRQHRAMATVSPGETTYTINGLNPRLGYCFTVLAVYSTDQYATSGQVCTERNSPTPQ